MAGRGVGFWGAPGRTAGAGVREINRGRVTTVCEERRAAGRGRAGLAGVAGTMIRTGGFGPGITRPGATTGCDAGAPASKAARQK